MIPVLLDCDTGIDDAVALVYLAARHRAGEINLVGVTTTAGNAGIAHTTANTCWVLERCGITDVPVIAGQPSPRHVDLVTTPETHGHSGLGYLAVPAGRQPTGASGTWQGLWRGSVDKHEDLRVIVTGPATNLAEFGPVDRDVTLMGGAYLYPGNTTPTAEWNAWVDPHAAKQAFAWAPRPIRVCSLGVTERLTIDPPELDAAIDALGDTPIAADLPEMLRFYFEFHEHHGQGYRAQLHDLLAAEVALGAVEYRATEATVDVEAESELMRGTTVADVAGAWGRPANAQVVTEVDVAAAHAEFLRACRLLGALHGATQRRLGR